jgi:nicotinate dehydrogenase subunit B
VADVAVNAITGEVKVEKVTVGHDAGLMINPDGVQHQIHGNVVQSTSRALVEQVPFDAQGTAALEWGNYPLITFPELPEIDVLMLPRPDEPPLGAGESASVPSAAAIANALYDATGIRFREPPFTPEKVRAALAAHGLLEPAPQAALPAPSPTARRRWRWALSGLGAGLAAGIAIASPWRAAMAPANPPPAGFYSAETLERGRQIAAAGDCAVCHTAPGGQPNAGAARWKPRSARSSPPITRRTRKPGSVAGRSPPLPAMREGISRDGHHLYPAFPYTAFAKLNDADIEALYAHLMQQPAVANPCRQRACAFPSTCVPAWRPGTPRSTIHARGRTILPAPPSGTGAPIWSKAQAIAAPATRRAMPSGPNAAARPAIPGPKSMAGGRHPWPAAAARSRGTSRPSSNICAMAMPPITVSPAGRWRR